MSFSTTSATYKAPVSNESFSQPPVSTEKSAPRDSNVTRDPNVIRKVSAVAIAFFATVAALILLPSLAALLVAGASIVGACIYTGVCKLSIQIGDWKLKLPSDACPIAPDRVRAHAVSSDYN